MKALVYLQMLRKGKFNTNKKQQQNCPIYRVFYTKENPSIKCVKVFRIYITVVEPVNLNTATSLLPGQGRRRKDATFI